MFLTPIKAALLWTLSAAIRDSFSFSLTFPKMTAARFAVSLEVAALWTDESFFFPLPKRRLDERFEESFRILCTFSVFFMQKNLLFQSFNPALRKFFAACS